jgi:PAS domain S-box-containing protein
LLLDLLFEDPATGRCLVAPDGSVLRASAEWLRATGLELDDVLGEDVLALFPEARRELGALLDRARAGERVQASALRALAGGRDSSWEGTIEPVALDGGTGLLLSIREVPRLPVAGAAARPEPRPDGMEILARIRRIADKVPAGVFVKDAAGRYLYVNGWLRRLMGVRRSRIVGRTVAEVLPPRVALQVEEHDRRVAAGEEVAGEVTIPTPDGDRALLTAVFPFPLRDGTVGTLGIALDVTERRRAQASLRESEERFRLLAHAMPQIVCVLQPDGAAEYVNPSWVAYSGLDLEATRRVGWLRVVHPDDVPAARECRRRALKERVPQDVELRYRGAGGSFRWFLSRLAPVVEGDHVVRLVGAAMDIEDRRRAEDVMRAQLALKDQLEKVAASVPGVVCSFRLGPDGAATMPSSAPGIAELYGFSSEVLARDMGPAFARTHPDDLKRVREAVAESARTLGPWHAEFRYDHPTKGPRWIEGTSIPSREPDGGVLWYGHVADVTDRKLAEEALRRSELRLQEEARRKDEFLAVLSHELRNPLAPIRAGVQVLRLATPGSLEATRALETVGRQAEHLTRLVDDLLDVTRIARGKIRLHREVLDLRALVERVVGDHRAEAEAVGIGLWLELPDAPAWIDADATRIAQAIGNLLGNALKFTPAGGTVTASLGTGPGRAEVRVRDTGIGMEPALIERLFEPFEQAEEGAARARGGLGLGLAVVRGLMEMHGGSVRAQSAGPGTGSEFVLTLPLALDASYAGRAAPRAEPVRRRVLVVEDGADMRQTLADLLRLEGHLVHVAATGREAISLARELRPDVVLCDIGLPDVDGYEVARALRRDATLGATRLVALTGYAQPEDLRRAAEAGFDRHITKPPSDEDLAGALEPGPP